VNKEHASCAFSSRELGPKAAPKGTKHQPQLHPAAACRPARTSCGPRMRPAPPQRHGRRRVAVARPDTAKQDRRPAPDATLWRQLPHELYPSAPPPCAPYRPDRTHSRPPSRRTGRSYRPHPLHRGAPQRHHRVLSPPAARNSAQAPVRSEFVLTAKFGGLRLTGIVLVSSTAVVENCFLTNHYWNSVEILHPNSNLSGRRVTLHRIRIHHVCIRCVLNRHF